VVNTTIGTVLAVVGAGALGTALALDLSATSDVNDMRTSCGKTGTCPSSRVNSDELDYDLAGVGLGIGIVAVGVATYVFLAHPFVKTTSVEGRPGHARGPSFQIIPSPHGSGFALTF
jgi:hypothetical protein